MECPNCHQDAPDTNYKCPHCHNVLKESSALIGLNREPLKTGNRSLGLTYTLAAIIVVGAALITYLFIQSEKKIEKPAQLTAKQETVYREISPPRATAPPEDAAGNENGEQAAQPADDSPGQPGEEAAEGAAAAPTLTHVPGEEVAVADLAKKGKTTIFDFFSDYCGPCRMISPRLEQLDRRRDDIVVIKIDINRQGVRGIDWISPVARQYSLRSIPYFVIYDAGGRMTHEGSSAWQQVHRLLYQEGI